LLATYKITQHHKPEGYTVFCSEDEGDKSLRNIDNHLQYYKAVTQKATILIFIAVKTSNFISTPNIASLDKRETVIRKISE
jgi:hypothetical protein